MQVEFMFPLKGLDVVAPPSKQPEGTSPAMLNVMPKAVSGRLMGATRPGQVSPTINVSITHTVYGLVQTAAIVAGTLTPYYVLDQGGNLYAGTTLNGLAACTSGTAALTNVDAPVHCFTSQFGKVYMVDGTNFKVLTLSTNTVAAFAATAGIAPTGAQLIAFWNDRLVVSDGTTVNCSRQGTYTDFDYAQNDAGAASAFNTGGGLAGTGDTITAIIPATRDRLYIGCERSLWCMEGDPGNGGILVNISRVVGVPDNRGWTLNPGGDLFFVAGDGLYVLPFGSNTAPLNISRKSCDGVFHVDWSFGPGATLGAIVAWDVKRRGCWIRTAVSSGIVFWWYDERTQGLFPMNVLSAGTTCCVAAVQGSAIFAGNPSPEIDLLWGTGAGTVYKFDDKSAVNDTAYFVSGPLRPNAEPMRTVATDLYATLGGTEAGVTTALAGQAAPYNAIGQGVTLKVYAGNDEAAASAAAVADAGTTLVTTYDSKIGRQTRGLGRVRGNCLALLAKQTNNNRYFAIDHATVTVQPAGRER